MAFRINNELQQFFDFAARATRVDQAAEVTVGGDVRAASKTASAFARCFSSSANTKDAIDINNRVREAFVNALKNQFNVEDFTSLPKTVKDALVGSHASSAEEDFGFNADGRVMSGKPLTARRIKSVMTALQEAQVDGNKLMIDFAAGASPAMRGIVTIKGTPQSIAKISPYIASENIQNPKVFAKKMSDGIFKNNGFDIYGQAANADDGLLTKDDKLGTPKCFAKDYHRTTFFILPGLGRVSYREEDGQKAADDVTMVVTKGRVRNFQDLTGKDLKKVLFVMTMMNQTIANAAGNAKVNAIFRKESTNRTPCGFSRTNGVEISIELVVEDNGDITFKSRNEERYNQFAGLYSDEIEGADDDFEMPLKPEGSYSVSTIELHYSNKKMEKILDADWDNMSENNRKNLIKADTYTSTAELHLEA